MENKRSDSGANNQADKSTKGESPKAGAPGRQRKNEDQDHDLASWEKECCKLESPEGASRTNRACGASHVGEGRWRTDSHRKDRLPVSTKEKEDRVSLRKDLFSMSVRDQRSEYSGMQSEPTGVPTPVEGPLRSTETL